MNLEHLLEPFELNEHKINYDGYIYIDEDAITSRLDKVCGMENWQWKTTDSKQVTQTHHTATVDISIMTSNGWVVRSGIGEGTTAINKPYKDGKDPLEDPRYVAGMGENAAKAAETDAFRRAARHWGIGRYLLDAGKLKGKDDTTGLKAWYNKTFPVNIDTLKNRETATAFIEKWREVYHPETNMLLMDHQILQMLGVSRLSEFDGTLTEANQKMQNQIDSLQNKPLTDAEKLNRWLSTKPSVEIAEIKPHPSQNGKNRWMAEAFIDEGDTFPLRITLWQEDVDYITEQQGLQRLNRGATLQFEKPISITIFKRSDLNEPVLFALDKPKNVMDMPRKSASTAQKELLHVPVDHDLAK